MSREETEGALEREGDNGVQTVHFNPNHPDIDDIRPMVTCRQKVAHVLHSHKFQLCVIGLVIFDCLLVLSELLIEVQYTNHHDEAHTAAHIIHYISIGVLSIFLVELAVKLYAFQLEFFNHKLELFDAIVVILSFALDVAFINSTNPAAGSGSGLIILLRLWRVARILNGVVLSVKTQAEHKFAKERKLKEALEQEVFQCKDTIANLELQISSLQKLLKQHGIPVPGFEIPLNIADK